jgi:hypothetical protein
MTGRAKPESRPQGELQPANPGEAADAIERDANGLPLFRQDAAGGLPPIDLATALRLEQESLELQDLEATLMAEWTSMEDEEAFKDL